MNRSMFHRNGHESTVGNIVAAMVIVLAIPYAKCAFAVTQSIALAPGWNAVYLEVDPANP